MRNRQAADFRLLTAAVFVAALLPRLAHRGMFLDGVTYASIARNLAEGRGHFWEPSYTATIYPVFHEHPPLGFWLESLYFRAFGDHWWVERLYCGTVAVIIALLIGWIWRENFDNAENFENFENLENLENPENPENPENLDWLPILFWITVPLVSWTIVGNLLESTVCLFVTAAVGSLLAPGAKSRSSISSSLVAGAISGLCVVAAALTKGPVGLFPLVAPLALGILPERRRPVSWLTAGQWTTVIVCAVVLYAMPSARAGLSAYIGQQVVATLTGQRGTAGNPATTVTTLVISVWLPLVLAFGLVWLAAGRQLATERRDWRIAVTFAVIGLAGTLPITMSPRQAGHYVMPAVPFFAIAIAALARGQALRLGDGLEPLAQGRALRLVSGRASVVAALIVAGAIASARLPALERDPARLADLDAISMAAPRGATVGICSNVNGNWLLHAWMQRRFEMSLDAAGTHRDWFLKTEGDGACSAPLCRPASQEGRLALRYCR